MCNFFLKYLFSFIKNRDPVFLKIPAVHNTELETKSGS
jgi:hypothetical protein